MKQLLQLSAPKSERIEIPKPWHDDGMYELDIFIITVLSAEVLIGCLPKVIQEVEPRFGL